jgi:hypothetical protein
MTMNESIVKTPPLNGSGSWGKRGPLGLDVPGLDLIAS